jgi:diacylglycerol kinase
MKSFLHAFCGVWQAVKTERNFRIHLAAVYYVILAGILFDLFDEEWALIALACGLVLGAELLNTALERLCDGLEPGRSPVIKTVKDLAAGAVLVCSITAACIAFAVFWNHSLPMNMPSGMETALFWAAAAALPFWLWFVFWFGRKRAAS